MMSKGKYFQLLWGVPLHRRLGFQQPQDGRSAVGEKTHGNTEHLETTMSALKSSDLELVTKVLLPLSVIVKALVALIIAYHTGM